MRTWGSRYAWLVFDRCGRNKRTACEVLDISYHTLQAYLRYRDGNARPATASTPGWVRSASAPAGGGPLSGE